MLQINNDEVAMDELFVFDKLTGSITNFCGEREIYSDLTNFKGEKIDEGLLIHSIKYIAEIHQKNFFHGDIKPINIFYCEDYYGFKISSDSGSLVQLDEDYPDKKYYIRDISPGYSS